MPKNNTPAVAEESTQTGSFPIPVARDVFRQALAEVYLFYVRNMGLMLETPNDLAGLPLPADITHDELLHRADLGAKELGVTYDLIQNTSLVQAFEQLYDYGCLGQYDVSRGFIDSDSWHVRLTSMVLDTCDGNTGYSWSELGWYVSEHAERCALIAELANARLTLEGEEPFYPLFQWKSKEGTLDTGLLTVRQLALLSGMEEMSIRAAANPKRANPLKTVVTDQGTRIEIAVAKEWLKAKGKYIPIIHVEPNTRLNLLSASFESFSELEGALQTRYRSFCGKDGAKAALDTVLSSGNLKTVQGPDGPSIELSPEDLQSAGKVQAIAQALEVSADLLMLRAKELFAYETLLGIEKELKAIMQKA